MSSPTITTAQQSDNIQQLALQSPPHKNVYRHLKDIQKTIQQRQKKTQVYTWTVEALQRQCRRQICEDRLLAEKHTSHSTALAHKRHQLEQNITQLTSDLQSHDISLQSARSYAQQRNTKYQLRQRQFHRYAKIPMVGKTYKQKYLRAQKKNQLAESDVASQRHGMDHIKDQRMMLSRQLQQQQHEESKYAQILGDIRTRIDANEKLDRHWQTGLGFWNNKVASLCLTMDQKVVTLQHLLRQSSDNDDERRRQQELVTILQTFRQTCMDFEQAETFGEQEYSLDKVNFICAKCMMSYEQDLPRPDKNHPNDILCPTCYQAAHTSMVIKKKLGFLHTPSSSSSSTSIISSSSPPPSRQLSFADDAPPSPPPKDYSPKHLVY